MPPEVLRIGVIGVLVSARAVFFEWQRISMQISSNELRMARREALGTPGGLRGDSRESPKLSSRPSTAPCGVCWISRNEALA